MLKHSLVIEQYERCFVQLGHFFFFHFSNTIFVWVYMVWYISASTLSNTKWVKSKGKIPSPPHYICITIWWFYPFSYTKALYAWNIVKASCILMFEMIYIGIFQIVINEGNKMFFTPRIFFWYKFAYVEMHQI